MAYEVTVPVPASSVEYAIQAADAKATLVDLGYTVIDPPVVVTPPPPPPVGKLMVTANAFSIKVDFPDYIPPTGKTVKSISSKGTGNAAFMIGTSTHFPLLLQGVNGAWSGGPMSIDTVVTFTDGSTADLGSQTITLQATNGTIVPQDGKMYAAGVMYGKGDFDFGGATSDYYYTDKNGVVCVRVDETTGGGGWQPYWPVSAANGVNAAGHSNLVLDVMPDVATAFSVSFMSNGDVGDGIAVTTAVAPAGVRTVLTVPLTQFKFTKPLLKFSVGTSQHAANNTGFNAYTAELV